ncbi:MAG: Shedu anti-phage system protein SduA domain-containing protein [Candidatus Hodarchaeota archaeon]
MPKFDPYEHLLRNFSKHKFKLFIEQTVFKPDEGFKEYIAYYGTYYEALWTVDKKDWRISDVAHVDVPNVGMTGCDSFSRWIFLLDHVENDLIIPKMIWPRASSHIIELANSLAKNDTYLNELAEKLSSDAGWPMYAIFYYLTNSCFDPSVKEGEFYDKASSNIRSIFLKGALECNLDFKDVDFAFGIGNPTTFINRARDRTIHTIKEIEARPDSMQLQFVEGRIEVTPSNKRKLYVYDKKKPRMILLDQIVDSRSFFTEDEIEEFELLLNKPTVSEAQLQKFLIDNPKFLYNLDYDEIRPQVSLIDESGSILRPDFFLKPIGKRLWDILDIKLPNVTLVAGSPGRKSLSHYVHRGKAQLMNYAKFFDDPRNRERIFEATGIDCFSPRLTLVIGKKKNVDEEQWNQIIAQERPFVNIIGYDELLERAKKNRIIFPKDSK